MFVQFSLHFYNLQPWLEGPKQVFYLYLFTETRAKSNVNAGVKWKFTNHKCVKDAYEDVLLFMVSWVSYHRIIKCVPSYAGIKI